ncbi:MAG: LysR family transcriptional regulator, partial [Pseudomonadota bacterium]
MDLRQLRHFVAVFERGNLSKAAEAIPISQPALTRSVKTLEDQLGVELFERHARGATPTAAGERLYHHAKSILAECARASRDAAAPLDELSGSVAVGVGALFSTHIVDQMVVRFTQDNPKVKLRVHQGYFEDLIKLLDLGEIELAFVNFPLLSLPENMEFEPLMAVHTSAFASAEHPLADSETVAMKELQGARWATVDQPHAVDLLEAMFVSEGLAAPLISVQTNSLSLIKSVVLSSEFIGLLPDHMFEAELAEGRVVRVPLPNMPLVRSAGLITRKEGFQRPITRAVEKTIRDFVIEL